MTTHHGANDQAQAEERLKSSEGRSDRIRKLFCYNGEAWREKSGIPESFNDPDNERKGDEHSMTWNAIQQAKQDCWRSRCENSTIK